MINTVKLMKFRRKYNRLFIIFIFQIENGTNGMICLSVFSKSGLPNDIWTLGGAFLSSVYTTFDLEHKRVGFANLS